MTERKQPREQMATHVYRKRESVNGRDSIQRREAREVREAPRKLQRVVTVPEYDLSSAGNTFARRQQELRSLRQRPQKYVNPVARAHAQSVTQPVGRSAPSYHTSPIPVRSGNRARMRRGFIWKLLGFLSFTIVMAFAAGFAFTGNAFRIKQVNVAGTRNNALLHDIQRIGLAGQNIFFVDLAGFTARVEHYPSVATASISKQWPDQVTVNVTERTPVMLWQTRQGTFAVDGQGMVIGPASETTGVDHILTVVDMHDQGKGQKTQDIHPGVQLPAAEIAFAVNVFRHVPQVVGITAFTLRFDGTMYLNAADNKGAQGRSGSFVIESPAGWSAYLGNASDANPLDNRLMELQQILAMAQQQQLQLATVDLRYGLHPVYTLKQQA